MSDDPFLAPLTHVRVESLRLYDFRNYASLSIACSAPLIAFYGDNGAGKTNLLEALSLLSPGRGLRRSARENFARANSGGGWSVIAEVTGPYGLVKLQTGITPDDPQRRLRIDGELAKSLDFLTDHCRMLWLTPAMDGLFSGPPGDRRKYLDRMVLAIDPAHGRRVAAYDQAVASRNKLLADFRSDSAWLDAVESQIAELGVAIALARHELVACLTRLIAANRDPDSAFPNPLLTLSGDVDSAYETAPSATDLEDWLRADLGASRSRDRAAGRTTLGPHTSDLEVTHGPKEMPAARCSTGEQKALLIALTLAQARLVADLARQTPVLLLDEIAAHLDPSRRAALFAQLRTLGCQTFMTGTDQMLFDEGDMLRLQVQEGTIKT